MILNCTCGHKLEFFRTASYMRSYCPGCGSSQEITAKDDPWPDTVHWLRDHSSHGLTDAQIHLIEELNTPHKPKVCENCNWPACIGQLCKLCCDMNEAIMRQPGLMLEHENWRRQRVARRLGLL